jgi:histidyl-tRNA synthetase
VVESWAGAQAAATLLGAAGVAASLDTLEIKPIRGTVDIVPPHRAVQLATEARFRQVFERYGYEPIDTPVLEPTELFLRKSGEEIAARMYAFSHWNRNLCLRPEFTASLIRAYVNQLQSRPLPIRLQYAGPTFRYEKPQRGRQRQFTHVGVECIGAAGPAADAEILAIARDGLDTVGLGGARFVVGHLGAVLDLLTQMGMEPRAQALVLGVMEHLARGPGEDERTVARLATLLGAGGDKEAGEDGSFAELLRSFGPETAAKIAGDLLLQADFSLEGGVRTPQEIVARLLRKAHRPDPTPALRRAIEFLGRLRDAAGPPADALPALRAVLAEFGLADGPVREVEQALRYFDAYFSSPADVEVNLALGRGLRYYTGLVFEVYDSAGIQIAGGGRYDDLVRALGGRQGAPACGFSYGLERVIAAAERVNALPCVATRPEVAVVPIAEEDYGTAARLATMLRRDGLAVQMDLRFRGLKASLRAAAREEIPLVLVLGEAERASGTVGVRDMRAFAEVRVPYDDLVTAVRTRLAAETVGVNP